MIMLCTIFSALQLGSHNVATVMILDDDHGGVFQLEKTEMEISEAKVDVELTIKRYSDSN
jgi:hypothetical protein